MGKYERGTRFASALDLCAWILEGRPVFFQDRVLASSFMRNQQLHTLTRMAEHKSVARAVPKKKATALEVIEP